MICRTLPVTKLIFSAFAVAMTVGCDVQVESETNSSAVEGKSISEAIAYWFSGDEFKACKVDGLEPLEFVQTLTNDTQKSQVSLVPADLNGDALAEYAIEFAQNLDIELSARDRDHIVMHLFLKAAQDESPIAFSEIGASLLFCYQHVEQDIPDARQWLERAVRFDDPFAMHSLARMHLAGLIDERDHEAIGVALIEQCAALGHEPCKDELPEIRHKMAKKK